MSDKGGLLKNEKKKKKKCRLKLGPMTNETPESWNTELKNENR